MRKGLEAPNHHPLSSFALHWPSIRSTGPTEDTSGLADSWPSLGRDGGVGTWGRARRGSGDVPGERTCGFSRKSSVVHMPGVEHTSRHLIIDLYIEPLDPGKNHCLGSLPVLFVCFFLFIFFFFRMFSCVQQLTATFVTSPVVDQGHRLSWVSRRLNPRSAPDSTAVFVCWRVGTVTCELFCLRLQVYYRHL